jgi:hypothetical protein
VGLAPVSPSKEKALPLFEPDPLTFTAIRTQRAPRGGWWHNGNQHHELEVVTILQGASDGIWMGKREGYVRRCRSVARLSRHICARSLHTFSQPGKVVTPLSAPSAHRNMAVGLSFGKLRLKWASSATGGRAMAAASLWWCGGEGDGLFGSEWYVSHWRACPWRTMIGCAGYRITRSYRICPR